MSATKRYHYRHPKTTQELRTNERDFEFVRPKRKNLPDSWADIYTHRDYGWKGKKRKKQWEKFSTGEKTVVNLYDLAYEQRTKLFDMLNKNGHFYRIDRFNHSAKTWNLTYWS